MAFNPVNSSYPYILRSTLQQTEEGLLYVVPKYRIGSRGEGGITTYEDIGMSGMILRRFELNASVAQGAVGIGFRWANRHWMAGQWTTAGSVFTNDTADAQDGPSATPDFPLMTTTANDGFIILAARPFSWVSLRIETADVGASADVVAHYSNFAGTDWTAVAAASRREPTASSLVKAAGANYTDGTERMFVWAPPADWGKVVSIGSVPNGYYALRFTTDVATTAAEASVIEIGSLILLDTLAANGIYENESSTYYDPYADALMAFFDTADAGNRVYAEVTTG